MPYFISNKASGCEGWATVKANGEVLSCHNAKQDAVDHMVALSLAEGIDVGGELNKRATGYPVATIVDIDDTLIHMGEPMQDVIDFVNGLEGRIFIITARPESQREETVKQLKRFGVLYTQLIMKSEDIPTPTFKKEAAQKLLETYDVTLAIDNDAANRSAFADLGIETLDPKEIDMPEQETNSVRDAGDWDLLNERQQKQAEDLAELVLEQGMFDQSSMANGAHYAPAADNPFKADGLICDNCIFFNESNNQCQIVSGTIEPEAVCKLWIIPESLIGMPEEPAAQEDNNARMASININLRKTEGKESVAINKVEHRTNTVNFDLRELDTSGNKMTFRGYAAVFNSPSQPLPFTEYIADGAFTRSLKSRSEIKMFKNHNTDVVLGSTRAKTLKLTQDSTGLLAESVLPNTSEGRDLAVLIERGDVNSMSFGFSVFPQGDSWNEDGSIRTLKQIRLHEVSIVTGFPAYEATTAGVRSLDILASRTAVDVDALAGALSKLESGETLEADQADLISEVVSKLRADAGSDAVNLELLEIKRKQLDLMLKAF